MTKTPKELADLYFSSWLAKTVSDLSSYIEETTTFEGPLAFLDNKTDILNGLQSLAEKTTSIEIKKQFFNDTDVMTWFILHVEGASKLRVVNWCQIKDGHIKHIHVTFDPRPLFA